MRERKVTVLVTNGNLNFWYTTPVIRGRIDSGSLNQDLYFNIEGSRRSGNERVVVYYVDRDTETEIELLGDWQILLEGGKYRESLRG